ncbi:site-specific recombinase XerD [Arcticibacter tournemirensis]|uniref:Site-specific integrase n=1 Tax=Arcticibacter tournemirensis TaxID=699437 RepID=A0A5M9GVM3_9SPHI|nr:site-specific integrase [Arcticibacter tournemirensis]KAA8476828.1 site-specific integrase [Arcticibacter tournemirensis]TQM49603.1 site-specific recombinase XerD [Arcticibacter tournemirensis]
MKTVNTFGIQFIIRQDKLKDGKAPIYARITVNGEIIHFALKQWINAACWDQRRGIGKGKAESIKMTNNGLEQVRMALGRCYQELQLKGGLVTASAVKDAFLGTDSEEPNTLSRLVEYHNEQAKYELEWSTLKHYYVTQRYLTRFLEAKFRKRNILLREINYKFIADFETFLRAHKPNDHQKPMNNNGVMKHLIRLRKMTNLALRLEWITSDPFKNYKIRHQKVDKDYLTQFELEAMEKKEFDIERLAIVRDLFVFCCYTGLAYVDVMKLTASHIVRGIDGEDWIKILRQKTNIPVNTPILPQAKQIMEKYQDHYRSAKLDTIFPVFSNQKVNSYLKEIADLCGIKKTLTFHIARHTFATTVTLSNGVPIETVSKMLGHTKVATTQIYARVLEQKISDDMRRLRKKLVGDH